MGARKGIKVDGKHLRYLRFGDDIVLFRTSRDELKNREEGGAEKRMSRA